MKLFGYTVSVIFFLLAYSLDASAQRIKVESASYGTVERNRDVTDQVQRFADFGEPFRVSNDTFRMDPAPGQKKTLSVVYTVEGQRTSDRIQEGDVFYFRSGKYADTGSGYNGILHVVDATYGARGRYSKVTRIVQSYARKGRPFEVSNQTFGVDPCPGVPKRLKIVYLRGGARRSRICAEGDVVRL